MNFTERIKNLRTKAQESQAANKIIDMLKDLESKNDEITAYRWVWELIQNAKDVPNSTGKVDIEINFDEARKVLVFKHNGRLFATKNIIFLIEQVSTKERGKIEKTEKTTGKFGTGFLTTHLLSRKVNVSGYIQDEGDPISKFNIDLDRTSNEQKEIIASIENSCNQLVHNSYEVHEEINENEFNTCFTYELDDYGKTVASEGINNLITTSPFIFAFVPQINSITINANGYTQIIKRDIDSTIKLSNSRVVVTCITANGKKTYRYIVLLNNEDKSVELAIEVENNQRGKSVCAINGNLPKLYCDFPLLGTNDFAFPVAINCRAFNPTEPRNGIFLTSKEDRKDPSDVEANKNNIKIAVKLYKILLAYFVKEQYHAIFNIVKIVEQSKKDWLSINWINENVIDELKDFISEEAIVKTIGGDYCSIIDLLLPTHDNKQARLELWKLASKVYPDKLPPKEEFENWYNSLWEDCHNFQIEKLIDKVESLGDLGSLAEIVGENYYDWLKSFYKLIFNRDYGVKQVYLNKKIIPNQEGIFCGIQELKVIEDVDKEYYDIARILNINLKSLTVDENLAKNALIYNHCERYNFDDLCNDCRRKLQNCSAQNKNDFYRNILRLKANAELSGFISLVKDFYEDDWAKQLVSKTSDELSNEALEFWIKKMIEGITNLKTLEKLADHIGCADAIVWLDKFFNCLKCINKIHLINGEELWPNQEGYFKSSSELYLDSGEIAEETKDVLSFIGKGIRSELLNKRFGWKFSRAKIKTNEEIATPIINYIERNQKKLDSCAEEKKIFYNFYKYLREKESDDNIKNVFATLYSHLHWFYNDEDIEANMQKVEEYDSLLTKYGVGDMKQLESILFNSKPDNKKIEVTSELLAQWGITSEEELNKALQDNLLGENFIYTPEKDKDKFNYVQQILDRAKKNILTYLGDLEEYDVSAPIIIAKTVLLIKKNGEEIYVIPRPSDYNKVVIYYNSELDVLDYEKDCELWVENGRSKPIKLTFGKILKLTGVNKIPLWEIRKR